MKRKRPKEITSVKASEPAVSNADELRRLLRYSDFSIPFYCSYVLRWAAAQTCAGITPLHLTRSIAPCPFSAGAFP